jgi:hypothetical protein
MSVLSIPSTVTHRLNWDYAPKHERLLLLYERAKGAQWNASEDIDWTIDVPFGGPLGTDSSFGEGAYRASPLAARGRSAWDEFRWEFQAWMVSQFLHGEQGALLAASRLAQELPNIECKYYAASQAADEARHVEAFSRYVREKLPHSYPVSGPLAALLDDVLRDSRWDMTALGMQIVIEALAMAAFRLARTTFNDPLIKRIATLVSRDEARHISFGVMSLQGLYSEMTANELKVREEFLIESAHLMRRRFLFEDVWDILDVDTEAGIRFTMENEMMIAYRKAVFSKVVSSIVHIGLMTPRVRDGLYEMQLLGHVPSVART